MNTITRHRAAGMALLLSASVTLLAGCGGKSADSAPADSTPAFFDMQLPASLTGHRQSTVQASAAAAIYASAATDQPCAFLGEDGDNPFVNGYQMTKFMTAAVAGWTCVADQLIEVAKWVQHTGEMVETDNNTLDAGYDREEPTHYRVVDDSATQTSIYLYYGYDRATPPQIGTDPQFFISWNEAENGNTSGRLVIDALGINGLDANPEDPSMMRMDFDFDATQKHADMYLRFGPGNQWADGFRITVDKDLTANPLGQVFVARGLIKMKRQFIEVPGVTLVPNLQMYTVSDKFGNGAAIAEFSDVAVSLPLGPIFVDQNLGNFLFTKTDRYYFQADGGWDYIHKNMSSAAYQGGSNSSTETNAAVQSYFIEKGLLGGTEVTDCLASTGNDINCIALMDAIFADGYAGQEGNQGTDPGDWRSVSLAGPVYLNSVYPNGMDWSGAFDYHFMP